MTRAGEAVEVEGHARLYPSVTNPHWLVLRARREIFRGWLRQISAPGMKVLDVGGRIQPYRPLIEQSVGSYIAVDLRVTPLVSVVADGRKLPFDDGQYDLVICTQTLQYADNPFEILAEIHRVLKPGGFLMLSVPSIYPCDSMKDGWRCFPPALRKLTAGFATTEIVAEGGTIIGIFRMLNVWIDWFSRPAWLQRMFRYSIIPLLNCTAVVLDRLIRTRNEAFSANFSVLARK